MTRSQRKNLTNKEPETSNPQSNNMYNEISLQKREKTKKSPETSRRSPETSRISPETSRISPETSRKSTSRKTVSTCSTNNNGSPPCKDGYYKKLNSKKEECCYKERMKNSSIKTRPCKDNSGSTDILSQIQNQHIDIQELIFRKLSPRTKGKVMMYSIINIDGDLQTEGENDIKKLFNELMEKTGESIVLPALNHIKTEGNTLCEKMRKGNLSVSPSVQTKHIVEYLKRKYKHLRKGTLHRLTKIERERGETFWREFENFNEKNRRHTSFKEAIQKSIDLFFYMGSSHFVEVCMEKLEVN